MVTSRKLSLGNPVLQRVVSTAANLPPEDLARLDAVSAKEEPDSLEIENEDSLIESQSQPSECFLPNGL